MRALPPPLLSNSTSSDLVDFLDSNGKKWGRGSGAKISNLLKGQVLVIHQKRGQKWLSRLELDEEPKRTKGQ